MSFSDPEYRKSVIKIENIWLSYRNRRIFKLLKHSVRAAEQSLSEEIIRRVCPRELELLKDKCVQVKVKFRFGSDTFPPLVYFKIYQTSVTGVGSQYVTGKNIHKVPSASRAACGQMGNRKYLEMLTVDAMQHQNQHTANGASEISKLRHYVKHCSVIDELPAYLGGRSNSWRKLTLQDLPRYIVFYDIIDYAYNHQMSPALQQNLSQLVRRPCDESLLLEQLRIVSLSNKLDVADTASSGGGSVTSSVRKKLPASHAGTARRSTKAIHRVERMKQNYNAQRHIEQADLHSEIDSTVQDSENLEVGGVSESEAELLYKWTQSLDDESLTTPKIF